MEQRWEYPKPFWLAALKHDESLVMTHISGESAGQFVQSWFALE
jgi:hypothetical protein